ncbi:MAG: TonB-dependent receptor [Bacteroidales bacterium]|nr:TonB-dependent receptor [Bacteroidales bacterium]
MPSQVLSSTELKRLNSLSIADAVRYFSGVQIKDYGGIGGLKTINVRSLGSQHVGVFYDGIQLGNAQNGQIDLGRFSLDNMEAVSLYNGQKSSSAQSAKDYASASSVYMRTRTPVFIGGKRTNLKASLAAGSFATVNPSILWEQKLSDNVSSSLSTEYLYTSGKYKFSYTKKDGYDTTAVRQNGDVSALRVEAGLFGKIPDGLWKAKAYFYNSERGYPGAFVREEPGKFRHEDRQWDRNFFAQGNFSKEYESVKFSLSAKYSHDYLRYLSDPRLDVTTMFVDNNYLQQEAYLSAATELVITDWLDADFAIDYQFNTLKSNLVNFVYPSRSTLLAASSLSIHLSRFTAQGRVLYSMIDDYVKVGEAAAPKNVYTPTAAFQYTPFTDKGLAIRGFYKKIFRMPTLNDLYYTFIGNKNLKPESATQFDLGLYYSKSWQKGLVRSVGVSADGYFNKVKDKIIAIPTSNQFQWTMINLGYVEIRGVDVSADASFDIDKVRADLRATYTFQKAQDKTDKSSSYYGGQIPYIPWHSGSVVASLQYRDWSLNYSFLYTGERYSSSANIPENHTQPWYTSDMSASKLFSLPLDREFKLSLELNNLFNQQYEVVQCYPMPGINFRIVTTFTL